MICAEGAQWKHRRKNISQAFNFDFIVSHIPMMVQIADKAFDEFEQKSEKLSLKGEKRKYSVDFFKMMTKYTSSIVISGFLGM